MSSFQTHSTKTAPEASKKLLEKAESAIGFVPNIYGVFAEEPAALAAYMALDEQFAQSSLDAQEQQIVLLSAAVENGCTYCVAAHSTVAAIKKLDDASIAAIRQNRPLADAKRESLRRLTQEIVKTRGWPEEAAVRVFHDAGYSKQQLLAVILGITMKTLSNYTNHIAKPALDDAFKSNVWEGHKAA